MFGHQLLDLVPRVLTARRALGPEVHFLISQVALDSFSALLTQFGLQDATLVALPADPNTGATDIQRLHLVTGARQDDKFDSERLEEIGRLATARPWPRGSERSVPSRAHLPQPQLGNRPLLNRAEIEDAFLRAGYRLVYPEEHSFGEMGQLVQGTGHLAGEDGSALHNVLWRPRETGVPGPRTVRGTSIYASATPWASSTCTSAAKPLRSSTRKVSTLATARGPCFPPGSTIFGDVQDLNGVSAAQTPRP